MKAKANPAVEPIVPHLERLGTRGHALRTLAARRHLLLLTLSRAQQLSRAFTFANPHANENLSRMRDALSTMVTGFVHQRSLEVPWYTMLSNVVLEQAQVDVAELIPHLSVLRGLPQDPDRLSNFEQGAYLPLPPVTSRPPAIRDGVDLD